MGLGLYSYIKYCKSLIISLELQFAAAAQSALLSYIESLIICL